MAVTYSELLYLEDSSTRRWQEYAGYGEREVITWSALQVPYEYAEVTTSSIPGFWAESEPYKYTTQGHGDVELGFIRDVFREIDKILEPEFIEVEPQDADILLVSSASDIEGSSGNPAAGLYRTSQSLYTYPTERGVRLGHLVWRDYNGLGTLSAAEMGTIVHEIGHSLGLSHPGGLGGFSGYDPNWDRSTSIMSYNTPLGVKPVFFRPYDIEALQSIWGAESVAQELAWPATESYPAVISSLPYIDPISQIVETTGGTETTTGGTETTTGGTETTTGGTETTTGGTDGVIQISSSSFEERNALVAKAITNDWWLKKQKMRIGSDLELDILLDFSGVVKASKKAKGIGKPEVMSEAEVAFIEDLANQISEECGLSVGFVENPSDADIILSSKAKTGRYSAYFDWAKKKNDPHVLFWKNSGEELTVQEQNNISYSVLASIGFRELKRSGFSTFDTIMSWNNDEYYGLTAIDKRVLREMWGEPF